jgi:hypothetical protein
MVASSSTAFTSYPMLLIGTKSVAVYETGFCNSVNAPNTAMSSTHVFSKLSERKSSLALTDVLIDVQ